VLDTGVMFAAAIVAVLAGIRFTVEGRRLDFLLCGGFFMAAASTMVFAVAPVFGGGTREIDVILWEMAQTRHLVQSAELAKVLETQLRASVPMSPRPIQQAPLRVLVGANMPAVLVELGYLTNAEQESALASAPFQARLAQAITEAVARFLAAPPEAPGVAAGGVPQ